MVVPRPKRGELLEIVEELTDRAQAAKVAGEVFDVITTHEWKDGVEIARTDDGTSYVAIEVAHEPGSATGSKVLLEPIAIVRHRQRDFMPD